MKYDSADLDILSELAEIFVQSHSSAVTGLDPTCGVNNLNAMKKHHYQTKYQICFSTLLDF